MRMVDPLLSLVVIFALLLHLGNCLQDISWWNLLDRRILEIHEIEPESFSLLSTSHQSGSVVCGQREDFASCKSSEFLFIIPTQQTVCHFLTSSDSCPSLEDPTISSKFTLLGPIPQFAKISWSVLQYIQNPNHFHDQIRNSYSLNHDSIKHESMPYHNLFIELNPIFTKNTTLIRDTVERLLRTINRRIRDHKLNVLLTHVLQHPSMVFSSLFKHLKNYFRAFDGDFSFDLSKNIIDNTQEGIFNFNCSRINFQGIYYSKNGFIFQKIDKIEMSCIVGLILTLINEDAVVHVSVGTQPTFLNYDVKGFVQSGISEFPLYNNIGLNGEGQIIGVGDSGVNDLSCFLIDDVENHRHLKREVSHNNGTSVTERITSVTSRDGKVEKFRRKIIQYVAYADGIDEKGEHGTHVCGSIVGNSKSLFSSMNGVASEAKIAFYDLGVSNQAMLTLPPFDQLFQAAYDAGARVHSDSWGAFGGIYGAFSFDVDHYLADHPDFLLVFAAGNSGRLGLHSISAPGNAKNVLTVGAGQLKDAITDEILGEAEYNVAMYSSLGPTYDGRYKPDIIAPGDSIVSAYAGDSSLLLKAVRSPISENFSDPRKEELETCAVHQNSGTSMSTPLVSGSVLLLRQYLMEGGKRFCEDSNFQLLNLLYTSSKRQAEKSVKEIESWDCSFIPSGYLLKTLIIHSGNQMNLYSDPIYNSYGGEKDANMFISMRLGKVPDYFQGYGSLDLKNVISSSIHLKQWKKILSQRSSSIITDKLKRKVYFWDKIELHESETIKIEVNMTTISRLFIDESLAIYPNSMLARYPLKVTICWYDPPIAFSFLSSLLVNDIDLFVKYPRHAMTVIDNTNKGNLYALGNKRDGIYSINDIKDHYVIPDDKNPNEQIIIDQSICDYSSDKASNDDCIFTVIVKPKSILKDMKQNFSLVISTYGTVIEPGLVRSKDDLFAALPLDNEKVDSRVLLEEEETVKEKIASVVVVNDLALPLSTVDSSKEQSQHTKHQTIDDFMVYKTDLSPSILDNFHKLLKDRSANRQRSSLHLSEILVQFQLVQSKFKPQMNESLQSELLSNAVQRFTPRNYQLIVTDSYDTIISIHANPFINIYYYFLIWPLKSASSHLSPASLEGDETPTWSYPFNVKEFNLYFIPEKIKDEWTFEVKEFSPPPLPAELQALGWSWKMKTTFTFLMSERNRDLFYGPINGHPIIKKLPKEELDRLNTSYSDDFDDNEDPSKYMPSSVMLRASPSSRPGKDEERMADCKERVVKIPFYNVTLQTYNNLSSINPFLFVSNHITLSKFQMEGFLQNITLHLHTDNTAESSSSISKTPFNPIDPIFSESDVAPTDSDPISSAISGINAWYFTVLIKSPQGVAVQVGGFRDQVMKNFFFSRRWPEIWMIKRNAGKEYFASRDLHAANLSSVNENEDWTVEVTTSFSLLRLLPKNYSGFIELSFLPREQCRLLPSPPGTILKEKGDDLNSFALVIDSDYLMISFVVICLIALIVLLKLLSDKVGMNMSNIQRHDYQPLSTIEEEEEENRSNFRGSSSPYYQSAVSDQKNGSHNA